MSSTTTRTALQHAVLGLVLVIIVVSVTICFNLLGIFVCSILTGMMFGTTRQSKWHVIPLSLLFPLVTICLLEFSRADIPPRRRILVSVLCWGAFAVTYLLAYALAYFERHAKSKSEPGPNQITQPAPPASDINPETEPVPADPPARLTLTVLQGRWSFEANPQTDHTQNKILQVTGDELLLCVTDANGHITSRAKARLKLE